MQEIYAKLMSVFRKKLSGTLTHPFDDNVIGLRVKIIRGPNSFLDRSVNVEIGIDEFVEGLSPEVATNLLNALELKVHPQDYVIRPTNTWS